MLRDIVDRLVRDMDDIDVAGDVAGAEAGYALGRTDANFVIIGRDDEQVVRELLAEKPAVEVLTVTDDGRISTLHRLVRQRTPLGELSAGQLLEIVRETMPRA